MICYFFYELRIFCKKQNSKIINKFFVFIRKVVSELSSLHKNNKMLVFSEKYISDDLR